MTKDRTQKEWYMLYCKGRAVYQKYNQNKMSFYNAEMLADYVQKEYAYRCKIVHYTEVDKEGE